MKMELCVCVGKGGGVNERITLLYPVSAAAMSTVRQQTEAL